MEALTHLDTHVVVWLAAGDKKRLKPVWKRLSKGTLSISPAVFLELQLLHEIGRLRVGAREVVSSLVASVGLQTSTVSFARACEEAANCGWTRDPFDRLIVGAALAEGARLVTKDETILARCKAAVWD